MKFSEIKTSVKTVLETGYVPFIRGLHGIGKSEMIKEIANEIANENDCEVSLHCVDMSHIKEGELTGMPITGKDPETGELINSYTLYNLFNVAIKEVNQGIKVILFFDEINRTEKVVFNELMQIVLSKLIQGRQLPKEIMIVAAGNPEDITKYKNASDDYAVLPMDPALKDRFFIFELDVDPVEWLKWATEDNHIDQDIIEFLTEYPNMLHFLSNNEINPTPRSWKMVSDVYKVLKKRGELDKYENDLITIGSGKIGVDTIVSFIRFIKENKNPLLKPKDFFNVKEEVFNTNINKMKNETPTRAYISFLNITNYYIENLAKFKGKKKDKDLLVKTYCEILFVMPNDILIGTLKELLNNNKSALNEITKYNPKKIIEVQKYLI